VKIGKEFFTAFKMSPKALKYLLESYYETSSHIPGDAYGTAFCEGRRQVMIDILDEMRAVSKEQYARLMLEVCLLPDEAPGTNIEIED